MKKTVAHQLSKQFIADDEMSKVLKRALNTNGLIDNNDTALIFQDIAYLQERINTLKLIFPKNTLHAVAVKANPLVKVLTKIKQASVGLEVATLPELFLAEQVNFAADKIIYDSPSKTIDEIEYALKLGVYINADSFDELDRIALLMKKQKTKSIIGVRVNPQVGSGSIKSTSVAENISKFGIPLKSNKDRLKEYYLKYDWIRGIHVHIGSQGCPVSLIVKGIGKVLTFAEQVNHFLEQNTNKNRITHFDLGGGLAVSYFQEKETVSMENYHALLKKNFHELFSGKYRLITEFGRYLHANTGWVASKVEYVKREKNYNILMIHVGADLLLRKCYNPDDWHHQITILDKNGNIKKGIDKIRYTVAGPLCFAGDIIARDIELPVVEAGDYLLIHDTGAYTLSMWSRYNSRQIPKVIGYNKNAFEILKQRETKKDLFDFWS